MTQGAKGPHLSSAMNGHRKIRPPFSSVEFSDTRLSVGRSAADGQAETGEQAENEKNSLPDYIDALLAGPIRGDTSAFIPDFLWEGLHPCAVRLHPGLDA